MENWLIQMLAYKDSTHLIKCPWCTPAQNAETLQMYYDIFVIIINHVPINAQLSYFGVTNLPYLNRLVPLILLEKFIIIQKIHHVPETTKIINFLRSVFATNKCSSGGYFFYLSAMGTCYNKNASLYWKPDLRNKYCHFGSLLMTLLKEWTFTSQPSQLYWLILIV